MNIQRRLSNAGFSLASTLIAVAIGGIVATLVASILSDTVRSQQEVNGRDQASEFTEYLKNQFMNDDTCTTLLQDPDSAFTPGSGTPKPMFLKVKGFIDSAGAAGYGYGGSPAPPAAGFPAGIHGDTGPILQDGFSFANKSLRVTSITIVDTLLPSSAPFTITMPNATGVPTDYTVKRYVVRVALQLDRIADVKFVGAAKVQVAGAPLRPRTFEFPVLHDGTKVIRCKNENSLADACAAMHFSWNAQDRTCLPGNPTDPGACQFAMPSPAGVCLPGFAPSYTYAPVLMGSMPLWGQFCTKGCDSFGYQNTFTCVKCQ
jgi:hypothetical protein